MLDVVVRDLFIAAEQPGGARVQVDGVEQVFAFEDVDAPLVGCGRFARFGWFVVF
jgi:hypothetical protein